MASERAIRNRLSSGQIIAIPFLMPALGLATFILVCYAWVFFRANSFEQAFAFSSAMFGLAPSDAVQFGLGGFGKMEALFVVMTMGPILAVQWGMRDATLESVANKCPWLIRAVILALMLIAIALMPGEDRAFIYFQF